MRNNCFDQILSTFPIHEACYVISFPSSLCIELNLQFFQSAQCGLLPGIEFLTRYFGRLPSQFVPFQCAPHSRLHTAQYLPLASRLFHRARSHSQSDSLAATLPPPPCSHAPPTNLPACLPHSVSSVSVLVVCACQWS